MWHDCQLNIVPAPGIARLATLPIYLSVRREPFSSGSCTGVVWLRQTTAATCVAEQTVFIHPPPLASLPLNPLTPFHPVPLSFSSRLSLHLSFALSLDCPSDQRHGTRVNFVLQTHEPLSVQLHVTFPSPLLAFDLKSELDYGRRPVLSSPA